MSRIKQILENAEDCAHYQDSNKTLSYVDEEKFFMLALPEDRVGHGRNNESKPGDESYSQCPREIVSCGGKQA